MLLAFCCLQWLWQWLWLGLISLTGSLVSAVARTVTLLLLLLRLVHERLRLGLLLDKVLEHLFCLVQGYFDVSMLPLPLLVLLNEFDYVGVQMRVLVRQSLYAARAHLATSALVDGDFG